MAQRRRGKNTQHFLVKIPNWVAAQWFDDSKTPNGAFLGSCCLNVSDKERPDIRIQLPLANDKNLQNGHSNMNNMSQAPRQRHPNIIDNSNNNNNSNSNNNTNSNDNNNNNGNNYASEKDIPIPHNYRLQKRIVKRRVNVKHGELKQYDKDELLIFLEQPKFLVNWQVEAIDTTEAGKRDIRENRNKTKELLDDDIMYDTSKKSKKNDKSNDNSMGNGNKNDKNDEKEKSENPTNAAIEHLCDQIEHSYNKGIITKIHNDRTYDVKFDNHGETRYRCPEIEIRVLKFDKNIHGPIDTCKKLAKTCQEYTMLPENNNEYRNYLVSRTDYKKNLRKESLLQVKKNTHEKTAQERERDAEQKIKEREFRQMMDQHGSSQGSKKKNMMMRHNDNDNNNENNNNDLGNGYDSDSNKRARKGEKQTKLKRVRKSDAEYEDMILKAFEARNVLTKGQLEHITGEPWNFLKATVSNICEQGERGVGGQQWKLKAEYRLHDDTSMQPPPQKRRRT